MIDTNELRYVAEAIQGMAANKGIEVSLDDPTTNAGLINLAADEIDRQAALIAETIDMLNDSRYTREEIVQLLKGDSNQ